MAGMNSLAFALCLPDNLSNNSKRCCLDVRGLTAKTSSQNMVDVFRPNQPSKAGPDHLVTREHAREMVLAGLAIWINSARAIRLLSLRQWKVAESLRIGPKTMEAFASGEPRAIERVLGWKGKYRYGLTAGNRQLG
jgi:hypothetical protein